MLLEKPYFLKNKEWYIENKGVPSFLGGKVKRQYILTDKAPQKAIDSYNEYYKMLEKFDIKDITKGKKKPKKKKELTVTVANPKTKDEYSKMIDNLNKVFKNRYSNSLDKKNQSN